MEQTLPNAVSHNTKASIDRKNNIILTLADEDGDYHKIFVPEPSRASFESILKVLQKFYSLAVSNEIPADVIVRDYIEIVKEIVGNDDQAIDKVHSFIDRSLSGATIFTAKGEFLPYPECTWDDEIKAICEGTLLFTSALCRYVPIQARKTILKDIITSLPLAEWKTQCLNSFKEQTQETIEG